MINETNTNDIKALLGPPSVTSTFDNDLWIYIEREITKKPLIKEAFLLAAISNDNA